MKYLLFVCMGNICRSPTVEGVVRAHLAQAGLAGQVEVDSAGTVRHHLGEPPDARAQRVALRRGYDLSRLRARRVTEADYARFDRILAMDRDNLAILRRECPPEHRHKLGLFLEYSRSFAEREVPDPYYGNDAGFERVLDLIEDASHGLVESLRQGAVESNGVAPS
jgi:protein-tyrosine phosphatase